MTLQSSLMDNLSRRACCTSGVFMEALLHGRHDRGRVLQYLLHVGAGPLGQTHPFWNRQPLLVTKVVQREQLHLLSESHGDLALASKRWGCVTKFKEGVKHIRDGSEEAMLNEA